MLIGGKHRAGPGSDVLSPTRSRHAGRWDGQGDRAELGRRTLRIVWSVPPAEPKDALSCKDRPCATETEPALQLLPRGAQRLRLWAPPEYWATCAG